MSEQAVAQPQKTNTSSANPSQNASIQRNCACGQHTVAGGECESCRKKRLKIQRWHKNKAEPELMSAIQPLSAPTSAVLMQPNLGHDFSQVQLRTRQPIIQRQPHGEATIPHATTAEPANQPITEATPLQTEATQTPESSTLETPQVEPAAPGETTAPSLLVADDTTDLGPGQMRKTEFLAELRTAVCAVADVELAAVGRDTEGCPYLDYWFDYYEQRDATHIERALSRYAPQARTATSAREYIPLVAERVRQGVARWARTGEISGVPEGIPLTIPGFGGLLAGASTLFFKAREGGANVADDPYAIQAQLGHGRPLDSGVQSRMEAAFGTNFSHVRLHNDSNAAHISSSQNARAFTVGKHVAFGAGEYQPGTILGDALIAHELAHVVQQGKVRKAVAPLQMDSATYDDLEADADRSTLNVVALLRKGLSGSLPDKVQNPMPRIRSGSRLRLQRCSTTRRATPTPTAIPGTEQSSEAATAATESVLCDPNRPLTWNDFQGTPTGSFSAWTRSHHELATEQGRQIIRAIFEPSNSWVQPRWANPDDRSLTQCDQNIAACEQVYNRTPPGGGTFTVPLNSTPSTTCPAKELANPSVRATSRAECTSVLGPECDRVANAESARLLRHEQLHFDIACVLAHKGTAAIIANPSIDPQVILNAVIGKSNQLTNDTNNEYDTETDHGCRPTPQAEWETKVGNGLPSVTIP